MSNLIYCWVFSHFCTHYWSWLVACSTSRQYLPLVYVASCQTAGPASFKWFLKCDVENRRNRSLTRVLLPPFRLQSRCYWFWGARRVPACSPGNVRVRLDGPEVSVCFLGCSTSSDIEKRESAFFLFPREQFLQRYTRLKRPHKPSKWS